MMVAPSSVSITARRLGQNGPDGVRRTGKLAPRKRPAIDPSQRTSARNRCCSQPPSSATAHSSEYEKRIRYNGSSLMRPPQRDGPASPRRMPHRPREREPRRDRGYAAVDVGSRDRPRGFLEHRGHRVWWGSAEYGAALGEFMAAFVLPFAPPEPLLRSRA